MLKLRIINKIINFLCTRYLVEPEKSIITGILNGKFEGTIGESYHLTIAGTQPQNKKEEYPYIYYQKMWKLNIWVEKSG